MATILSVMYARSRSKPSCWYRRFAFETKRLTTLVGDRIFIVSCHEPEPSMIAQLATEPSVFGEYSQRGFLCFRRFGAKKGMESHVTRQKSQRIDFPRQENLERRYRFSQLKVCVSERPLYAASCHNGELGLVGGSVLRIAMRRRKPESLHLIGVIGAAELSNKALARATGRLQNSGRVLLGRLWQPERHWQLEASVFSGYLRKL